MAGESANTITAPVGKAVASLAMGTGTSVMSKLTEQADAFLPKDANGWMALTASTVAVLYSFHLLGEWYWKKVWRPFAERRGWIKPRQYKRVVLVDSEDGIEAVAE
jgi:hypothetical protein